MILKLFVSRTIKITKIPVMITNMSDPTRKKEVTRSVPYSLSKIVLNIQIGIKNNHKKTKLLKTVK